MKKIFISMCCLLIFSLCASVVCASSDADHIVIDETVQIPDQYLPVSVVENCSDFNVTGLGDESFDNQVIRDNCTVDNCTADNVSSVNNSSSLPKLDIKGPKIHEPIKFKVPVVSGYVLPQLTQDAFHYARIFYQHPEWSLANCCKEVFVAKPEYMFEKIAEIVARAHNIALHKYNGTTSMVINKELTQNEVFVFMMYHTHDFIPYLMRDGA